MSINKIGLDLHGVIDKEPIAYISFAKHILEDQKGEVYIITGSSLTDGSVEKELLELSKGYKFWTSIVSINDELLKTEENWRIDKYGRPSFDEIKWNRFKGNYCEENKIDLHVDDTLEYKKYFNKTEFIHHNDFI